MNDCDTCITGRDGGSKLLGLALQNNFTLVGLIDTSQNLNQSRLTSAIFANQTMNGTTLNADGNIVQSLNTGELFGNVLKS